MGRDLNAHKISRRSTAWFRVRAEIPQNTRLFVAYKLGNRGMYVDTMFIGANMTEAEERTLAELA